MTTQGDGHTAGRVGEKCLALAKHFLRDEQDLPTAIIEKIERNLARDIQDTIEDFLENDLPRAKRYP